VNNRRKLVMALGAGAIAVPFGAFAQQQGKVWRVGVLTGARRPDSLDSHFLGGFPRGMLELGYVEGKNLMIEWRFANGIAERVPDLAAELVRLNVDAIVAGNTPAVSALQKATSNIPIVMTAINDPVGSGLIKSLAHPGGNITGLSIIGEDIHPKLLEMLHSTVPKLVRVAVLVNPTNLSHGTLLKNVQAAAQKVRVNVLPVEAKKRKRSRTHLR
jgi:putative ABC transport system substrate-binding protein